MITEPYQKRSLADLTSALAQLEYQMDESNHITSDQVKQWSFARDLLQTKTNGWIAYLDLAESQISMAEARQKRATAQLKSKQNVLKGLHSYLAHVLNSTDGRKIVGSEGEISLVKNPPSLKLSLDTANFSSDVVLNEFQVNSFSDEFIKTVTLHVIDKAAVKNALKNDVSVPYAELVCSERIKIK